MSFRRIALPIATLAAIAVAWQIAVDLLDIIEILLPSPLRLLSKSGESGASLLFHSTITAYESLLGFIVATAVGFAAAVLIFYSELARKSVYPLLVIAQVVPKTALAPLFLVWFGYGVMPKVSIAMLIAFFPVVVTTVQGLGSVEPELMDLVRSYGSGGLRTFLKVRLPKTLPHIFAGFKISITLALVGAIVGEFMAAKDGLGFLILQSSYDLDTPLMLVSIVISAFLGLAYFGLVSLIERLLLPWHVSRREAMMEGYL